MQKHNAKLTPLISSLISFNFDKSEHIYGLAGNNIIDAGARNDYIEGGAGNDTIQAVEAEITKTTNGAICAVLHGCAKPEAANDPMPLAA